MAAIRLAVEIGYRVFDTAEMYGEGRAEQVLGAALDDPNRGLEILRGIGQGSAVTLTVERGGQQQQITVDPVSVVQELQAPVEDPVEDEEPVDSGSNEMTGMEIEEATE